MEWKVISYPLEIVDDNFWKDYFPKLVSEYGDLGIIDLLDEEAEIIALSYFYDENRKKYLDKIIEIAEKKPEFERAIRRDYNKFLKEKSTVIELKD
jgi:hypothetical protein